MRDGVGSVVVQACAACGGENPDGHRFCGLCGATLARAGGRAAEAGDVGVLRPVRIDGDGRAGRPGVVFELMRSYFDAAAGALERHGGTVEKFIGDAVVAVFGVPEAHEDDALRACRAALEMQERRARA